MNGKGTLGWTHFMNACIKGHKSVVFTFIEIEETTLI